MLDFHVLPALEHHQVRECLHAVLLCILNSSSYGARRVLTLLLNASINVATVCRLGAFSIAPLYDVREFSRDHIQGIW